MITRVGGSWNNDPNTHALPITSPQGTRAGDLLIAMVVSTRGLSVGAGGGVDSMSGGWTQITTVSGNQRRLTMFWRFAMGPAETFTASWEANDTEREGVVHLVAYRGVMAVGATGSSGGFKARLQNVDQYAMPSIAARLGNPIFGLAIADHFIAGDVNTPEASWATDLLFVPVITGTYTHTSTPPKYTHTIMMKPVFSQAVELIPNLAPYAPSLSFPVSEPVDRNVGQRFSWSFNDPNTGANGGDTQSAYSLRYRRAGTSSWTSTGWVISPASHRDMAAGAFSLGDYEWQVATKDAGGLEGPFSASGFFTAGDPVTTHSITDPPNNATIPTPTHTVTWSTPDQDAYQVQIVDGQTVLFDSDVVEQPATRRHFLTFESNHVTRTIRLRVRHGGLWSAWNSVQVHLAYTEPAAPHMSVRADDKTGSITVRTATKEPEGTQPVVESQEVWVREVGDTGDGMRIATDVTPDGSWTWYLPAAGVDYEFRVLSIGVGGATGFSQWISYHEALALYNEDGTLTLIEPYFYDDSLMIVDNGDGTLSLGGSAVTYKNGTILIGD